jgi:dihydropteroate synthase
VIPVIQTLSHRLPSVRLSVDTTKAEVARQALEEGAFMVNDVSALADPWMPVVVRDHDAPVVLMHRLGDRPRHARRPGLRTMWSSTFSLFSMSG